MNEYRARVLLPAFYLTLVYFIFRYLSGKNPTSPLWPIYVISVSFVITQIIAFLTFLPLTTETVRMLILTLFISFVARQGHNKRKNEIL
jgi:glucan phosphoethanolaminetransferase (alkaline phosphatase superfamily)